MLDVALGSLNQVGDQVVTPFQLHFDLGKGILVSIFQNYQLIENRDHIKNEQRDYDQ